jgi:hypothetical protein
MNLNEQPTVTERATSMKRTHLIAALVALVAAGILAADASAMYNPSTGTFMQRDPGARGATRIGAGKAAPVGRFIPRDQYRDGMNLYQYARGNPLARRDPSGLASENERACSCGPDVTAWFRHELSNQAEYVSNMFGSEAQRETGTSDTLSSFAIFAQKKMEMSKGMEYRSKSCWASGTKDTSDGTGNCHASVTLCGKCTRLKNLGNIVFGYAGLSAWSQGTLDAAFVEGYDCTKQKNNRQWDSYKAGKALEQMLVDLSDEKKFCATINSFTNQQYWHGAPTDFSSWKSCAPCEEKYEGTFHQVSDADVERSRKYLEWLYDE